MSEEVLSRRRKLRRKVRVSAGREEAVGAKGIETRKQMPNDDTNSFIRKIYSIIYEPDSLLLG
jgi:hypothetical protein